MVGYEVARDRSAGRCCIGFYDLSSALLACVKCNTVEEHHTLLKASSIATHRALLPHIS